MFYKKGQNLQSLPEFFYYPMFYSFCIQDIWLWKKRVWHVTIKNKGKNWLTLTEKLWNQDNLYVYLPNVNIEEVKLKFVLDYISIVKKNSVKLDEE